MGHRNIRYSGPMVDMDMDQQGQVQLNPYGIIPNFPQPNVVIPTPGNGNNFDVHYLPEPHGSYGMRQYNVFQHQFPAGNINLSASATSNHYNMYMASSSSARGFPVRVNSGPHDQYVSTNPGVEFPTDINGRNAHFIDGLGGSFKAKNAEFLPINFQYYASTGASSSATPMGARPVESNVGTMDASFAVTDGRGHDMSSVMDIGSHRGMRDRSGVIGVGSLAPHNTNHLIRGQYPGQVFQTAPAPWIDQQLNSTAADVGALTWNQPQAVPYIHGNFNGGCMEAASMGVPAYQVTTTNRPSATFLPPPMLPGHFSLHHPSPPPQARPPLPPMQGVRGRSLELHSQVATSSRRPPPGGTLHTGMNTFQGSGPTSSRLVGSVQPAGVQMHRPQRRERILDASARQHNLHYLRVLPEDGVALLELSDYHEMGDFVDNHRDMRLDIDHMSYEELLALGEQIGSVGSGLSEDFIVGNLKSKTFTPSLSSSNMEETASVNQEVNFCVICQTEYKDEEKISMLDCGHEYHLECLKKWLLVKNSCPICKSAALTTGGSKEE